MLFTNIVPPNALVGHFQPVYVILSYVVAFLASYTAFNFALQLQREKAPALQRFWHVGGALVLGSGIWCMHFTGMLAYNIGMAHRYDVATTLLSLLLPIVFAYVILYIIKDPQTRSSTILWAAPFLGAAVVSMHYTGMAAMRMRVDQYYTPGWFAISVLIAVFASGAALWFIFLYARMDASQRRWPFHVAGAALMALAVCGLHYAGMKATVFVPLPDCRFDSEYPDNPNILAVGIAVIASLVFAIATGALRINAILSRELREGVAERLNELEKANRALARAKESAESANIAKSEFLASMSHEIRTPMNAIIGIANILQNDMVAPERRGEFMATLQTSAESLLALLNEILDLSKIEANKIQIESIVFDLRELLEEIRALISVRAAEKGLSIALEYEASCATQYRGDPLRIRQIVVNLLSNAVKFTDEGAVRLLVSCTPGDQQMTQVEIHVQDTGIGIPPEKLEEIFGRFIQADSSTTRKYGGTGLGLTICKALAEKMHGSIRAQSVQGKGSTFTLAIPLLSSTANDTAVMPMEREMPVEKPRPLVLLAEDSPANIMVATGYLDLLGYDYDVAKDGRAALAMYRRKRYDLILMDIHMPELDGFDTTRAIRETEDAKPYYTPIIALTAFATMHDREKCLRHGMDDYVAKPYALEDLKVRMELLLELQNQRLDLAVPGEFVSEIVDKKIDPTV